MDFAEILFHTYRMKGYRICLDTDKFTEYWQTKSNFENGYLLIKTKRESLNNIEFFETKETRTNEPEHLEITPKSIITRNITLLPLHKVWAILEVSGACWG